jgi:hypothetical protein
MPVVFCAKCSGTVKYFGEALMGSLTCDGCGDSLSGVGWEFIKTITDRWIRGDRGFIETLAAVPMAEPTSQSYYENKLKRASDEATESKGDK